MTACPFLAADACTFAVVTSTQVATKMYPLCVLALQALSRQSEAEMQRDFQKCLDKLDSGCQFVTCAQTMFVPERELDFFAHSRRRLSIPWHILFLGKVFISLGGGHSRKKSSKQMDLWLLLLLLLQEQDQEHMHKDG